jgi:hypothetical protein
MRAAPLSDSSQARAARAPATQPDQTGESRRIARGVSFAWSNHVARGAVLPWMSTSAAEVGRVSLPGAAQERSRKEAKRSRSLARGWVGMDIWGVASSRRPGSTPGYGVPAIDGHAQAVRTTSSRLHQLPRRERGVRRLLGAAHAALRLSRKASLQGSAPSPRARRSAWIRPRREIATASNGSRQDKEARRKERAEQSLRGIAPASAGAERPTAETSPQGEPPAPSDAA